MRAIKMLVWLAIFAVSIFAEIGWCGEIWPNSESEHPVDETIPVYFQIWKDGVTDSPGRGESISAKIYWREAGSTMWEEVTMAYNTDIVNNDEYTGDIPAPTAEGDIEFYCEALDSTDMMTATGTDQNDVELNETTPGVLHIVDVTEIDVTVTFQVDMTIETVTDVVTVSGSFNSWNTTADTLTDPDMDNIYTVDILFPAGSSPGHEYKFVNSGTYETTPNRILTINDSSPTQILPVAYFEDRDPADYTDIEIMVHFSVDMTDETVTDPYIAGSVFPLVWGWDVGWSDSLRLYDDGAHDDGSSGDGVYGAHIWFPPGSYRNVEYKYTTDGTDNEPLPPFENHTFELGDSTHQFLPMDVFGELEFVRETELPSELSVRISPNPFNSAATITINTQEPGLTDVNIFDIEGRYVATLFNGIMPSGKNTLIWTTRGKQSGIYFLRVNVDEKNHISKLLLMK